MDIQKELENKRQEFAQIENTIQAKQKELNDFFDELKRM